MKTVLVDAKAVLESKLSKIDQRLDKADNVATIVDNSMQSLVQLHMTYPWLQVKLRSPPKCMLSMSAPFFTNTFASWLLKHAELA